jgi:CO dehydrogenase/acetyl-CoA synthase alpha subunit
MSGSNVGDLEIAVRMSSLLAAQGAITRLLNFDHDGSEHVRVDKDSLALFLEVAHDLEKEAGDALSGSAW